MNKNFLTPSNFDLASGRSGRNFAQPPKGVAGGVQADKAARVAAGLALNYAPFTDTLGGFDASLLRPSGSSLAPHRADGPAFSKLN
jgi:hypothetical protein